MLSVWHTQCVHKKERESPGQMISVIEEVRMDDVLIRGRALLAREVLPVECRENHHRRINC